MPKIDFLCLASSRRSSGRCVAGIDLATGAWVRPVPVHGGEFTQSACQTTLGRTVEPGDVVRLKLDQAAPLLHQPENWIIGGTVPWKALPYLTAAEWRSWMRKTVISVPDLFGSAGDRISMTDLKANPPGYSLAVVEPSDLTFLVTTSMSGNPQVRARFTVSGQYYDLVLTDLLWEAHIESKDLAYLTAADTDLATATHVFLCLSLAGGYQGSHFKLVAGILSA